MLHEACGLIDVLSKYMSILSYPWQYEIVQLGRGEKKLWNQSILMRDRNMILLGHFGTIVHYLNIDCKLQTTRQTQNFQLPIERWILDDHQVNRKKKFILRGQAGVILNCTNSILAWDGGCEVSNQKHLLFSWSGELPYPDITKPHALISFLSLGKRMPRPIHCCEET